MRTTRPLSHLAAAVLAATTAGCAIGPDYQLPESDTPPAFKEAGTAGAATAPPDLLERGPWWELFSDPVLNELASRVEVTNNTVIASIAAYEQARAVTAQQRAAFFPQVGLSYSTQSKRRVEISATWVPDLFGRIRRSVAGAQDAEQATEADYAGVRLAAQGELAASYLALREADAARAILATTIEGYRRAHQITQNRYQAGIAARTDVFQAQTQLSNAQADMVALEQQRAQFEHAVAVLVGKSPASFSLPVQPGWQPTVPDIPVTVPARLLERRPDVVAAERRVAQANEQIGIAQAGYFPEVQVGVGVQLTNQGGMDFSRSPVGFLAQLAQTLFNAGATGAQVDGARAGLDAATARYRQAVLVAQQAVEDQLAATRLLEQQLVLRQEASAAADQAEQQVLNRYTAGQVGYTEVISAQVTAQNARRALLTAQVDRQSAAIALIEALGGGWPGLSLRSENTMKTGR